MAKRASGGEPTANTRDHRGRTHGARRKTRQAHQGGTDRVSKPERTHTVKVPTKMPGLPSDAAESGWGLGGAGA